MTDSDTANLEEPVTTIALPVPDPTLPLDYVTFGPPPLDVPTAPIGTPPTLPLAVPTSCPEPAAHTDLPEIVDRLAAELAAARDRARRAELLLYRVATCTPTYAAFGARIVLVDDLAVSLGFTRGTGR